VSKAEIFTQQNRNTTQFVAEITTPYPNKSADSKIDSFKYDKYSNNIMVHTRNYEKKVVEFEYLIDRLVDEHDVSLITLSCNSDTMHAMTNSPRGPELVPQESSRLTLEVHTESDLEDINDKYDKVDLYGEVYKLMVNSVQPYTVVMGDIIYNEEYNRSDYRENVRKGLQKEESHQQLEDLDYMLYEDKRGPRYVFEDAAAMAAVRKGDSLEVDGNKIEVEKTKTNSSGLKTAKLKDGRLIKETSDGQVQVNSRSVSVTLTLDVAEMNKRAPTVLKHNKELTEAYVYMEFCTSAPGSSKKEPGSVFEVEEKDVRLFIYEKGSHYFTWRFETQSSRMFDTKSDAQEYIRTWYEDIKDIKESEDANLTINVERDEIDLLDDPELCSKVIFDNI
jgi:hypothetical protein